MDDTSRTLKPWVTFAGCVLVIVVLYSAQAVLVPIALAVLLTFVLTPAVGWLERWLGRVPAVLAAATLVFIVLGLAGWGLARQMDHLADDLPTVPRQYPGEDRGRPRSRKGRIGRQASRDDRRDQDRPWTIERATRNGLATRSRDLRPGCRFPRFFVAWSDRRSVGHRRPGAGDGDLHAARAPGPA